MQKGRQTDRQAGMQTGRQTDRQAGTQTGSQINRRVNRKERHKKKHRQTTRTAVGYTTEANSVRLSGSVIDALRFAALCGISRNKTKYELVRARGEVLWLRNFAPCI